jgi:hypothetical protein
MNLVFKRVMKTRFSFLWLFIFTILVACETNVGTPVYTGEEYFGLTEGKYLVYNVDSIVYDDFLGQVFHYNYQVKEWNKEFYDDSQGNQQMRLERFVRLDQHHQWQIKNVWIASIDKTKALKTEENQTFVKLAFPLKLNLSWDGNLYNSNPAMNYRIVEIHQPMVQGDLTFDSTLTVLQRDFITIIGEDSQYEIFAKGVGMIYKKYVALSKEIDGTITRGVNYSYTLEEIGYE